MANIVILFIFFLLSQTGSAYSAEKSITLNGGVELVYIPDGEFVMGGNRRDHYAPPHDAKVKSFYIGKYEVTNAQYKKFCDAKKKKYPENPNWDDNYFLGKPDYPVLYVTWRDAFDYAKWAGGRLPTEAEWEHACKAGTTMLFYWGDDLSHDYLNYRGTEGVDQWENTSPVGSFPPNPFGLHDMLGNVWEWVNDWYSEDYYKKSPKDNPKGPKTGDARVLKGSDWYDDHNEGCADRDYRNPSQTKDFRGFRIAKDAK